MKNKDIALIQTIFTTPFKVLIITYLLIHLRRRREGQDGRCSLLQLWWMQSMLWCYKTPVLWQHWLWEELQVGHRRSGAAKYKNSFWGLEEYLHPKTGRNLQYMCSVSWPQLLCLLCLAEMEVSGESNLSINSLAKVFVYISDCSLCLTRCSVQVTKHYERLFFLEVKIQIYACYIREGGRVENRNYTF